MKAHQCSTCAFLDFTAASRLRPCPPSNNMRGPVDVPFSRDRLALTNYVSFLATHSDTACLRQKVAELSCAAGENHPAPPARHSTALLLPCCSSKRCSFFAPGCLLRTLTWYNLLCALSLFATGHHDFIPSADATERSTLTTNSDPDNPSYKCIQPSPKTLWASSQALPMAV